MSPKISVIMSVLNGEAYLRAAVDSILDQTFGDFEFVIIDNASTDATAGILDSYADARIVRLRNDGVLSLTQSLNIGLEKARGEYIARQDADDISAPSRFARQVAVLDNEPETVLVGTHVRMIDERRQVFASFTPPADAAQLHELLPSANPFVHSSCMFRRDAALSVGGYPVQYVFAQDLALWLLLAGKGRFGMIAEPLVDLREHSGQTTHAPAYRILRHREAIDLFEKAQHLPNLSDDARRRGREHLARLHGMMARDLLLSGQVIAAAGEVLRGLMLSPMPFIRYLCGSRHVSPAMAG